jgi:hypothetical protein
MLAITYNIADPDNGSCEQSRNEMSCMKIKSSLNSEQPMCYWTYDSGNSTTGSGSCHYRPINNDLQRVVFVALISAILSTPIAVFTQYLIREFLAPSLIKPNTQVHHETSSASVMKLISRESSRIRNFLLFAPTSFDNSPIMPANYDESSEAEFNALVQDLRKYRATLSPGNAMELDGVFFASLINDYICSLYAAEYMLHIICLITQVSVHFKILYFVGMYKKNMI